jgi:hypothetical protein
LRHTQAANQSVELGNISAKLQAVESAYFNAKINFGKDLIQKDAEIKNKDIELESVTKKHELLLELAK